MAKIIIKHNENNGHLCLFDTKSEQFFANGCVRDAASQRDMLNIANRIANKTPGYIISLAGYATMTDDNGYLEYILAKEYLRLNPDLRDVADDQSDVVKKKFNKHEWNPNEPKRKRGRPSKNK